MPQDGENRERFKTVRFTEAEFALIEDAALRTRKGETSTVIRDGALARAREIIEREAPRAEKRSKDVRQKLQENRDSRTDVDRWLEKRRREAAEVREQLERIERGG